jgi:hypothetical protein
VASKATRKLTVGITTRMQERDPRTTRRMRALVVEDTLSTQAALQFWRETVEALAYMKYSRSKADPCLNFKWISGKLQVLDYMG